MKTIVGVFSDAAQARQTFHELVRSGFGPKDISIVTGLPSQRAMNLELKATEAPDTGPIAGRGPLVETIGGIGHRELSSSLRNVGLSAQLAAHYADAVKSGETLESIVVDDKDADRAVAIMSQHAAPYQTATEAAAASVAGPAAVAQAKATLEATTEKDEIAARQVEDGEARIPILQEEMRVVGTRQVERGHVHISVRSTEHPVSQNVNLREEHIYVERRPANRVPTGQETRFADADIDLTERGEEPIVAKEVRVVEEVVVRKRVEAHDETIRDNVRGTKVEVTDDRFDKSYYRKHFDSIGSKGRFEDHLPAYELGHKLRGMRASKWEDVEMQAKGEWEAKRPGTWDKIKDHVLYAWSKGRS